MTISIIAAVAENGVIGNLNNLPWRLPADLKHFAATTKGRPVIMGRKTYQSILSSLGRPLQDRTNIIVTRQEDLSAPGCVVAHSFESALEAAGEAQEVFVIGGAEMYRLALPHASRLYLTRVHARPTGDAFFPPYEESGWALVHSESHQKDEKNQFDYTFEIFERKS